MLQLLGFATLGGSDHGGVTVRISSSDPAIALVAPDATTAGTSFIPVFVPDGQTTVNYVLQGVSGATGTVTVTASSPQFTDGTRAVDIVQSVFQISGLNASTTTLSADDPFRVSTGVPNSSGTNLGQFQNVSAAGGPLTVTLTSSAPAVGGLTTSTLASTSPVTVDIPVNANTSPSSVVSGGVAFDEGVTSS